MTLIKVPTGEFVGQDNSLQRRSHSHRDELGLHEDTQIAKVADRTLRHHKGLVRARLGLVDDQGHARKVAEEAIRAAVQVKDNPADLINVALEELVKAGCELPAFSTLDRMAGDIRAEVNSGFFGLIHSRMGTEDHVRMLGMVRVDSVRRSRTSRGISNVLVPDQR